MCHLNGTVLANKILFFEHVIVKSSHVKIMKVFFFGCYFEGSTISQTNFIAHIIVGMEKINGKFQTCPPLFNVATFPIPTLPHLHPSPHLFCPLNFFFLYIINLFVSIRGIKVNLYNLYFLLFYFSSQPNKNVFYPSTFLLLNQTP